MTRREAQLLTVAIDGQLDSAWEQHAANSERPFLYQLMNKQLIEHDSERYTPHPDVLLSLGLGGS